MKEIKLTTYSERELNRLGWMLFDLSIVYKALKYYQEALSEALSNSKEDDPSSFPNSLD